MHLYAPGRLLHLRRPLATCAAEACSPSDSSAPPTPRHSDCGGSSDAKANGRATGKASEKKKKREADLQLEGVELVEVDPPEARFEFIAVRSSWLRDHWTPTMLAALDHIERRYAEA
jgi:hypothetical protein